MNLPSLTLRPSPTISSVAYVVDSSADFKIDRSGLANWLALGSHPKILINDLTSAGSGSLAGSALDISQYWSTSGNPTAIKLNVTEGDPVSSGDNSQLLDLQVNSVSLFKISKVGFVQVGDGNLLGGISVLELGYLGRNTPLSLHCLAIKSSSILGWTDSTLSPTALSTIDVRLSRDAANVLALKNTTNIQEFRIYKTGTTSTAYERLSIKSDASNFYISPEKGPVSGVKRPLFIDGVKIGLGSGEVSTNISIGTNSILNNYLGSFNIGIGHSSLSEQSSGAATVGSILGGSLYTPGSYTGIQSTYVSGPTASSYPIFSVTVGVGGNVTNVVVTTPGYGFTSVGTVLTAVIPGGSGFSCQVATLKNTSNNIAIGYEALRFNRTGDLNTSVGSSSLRSNTYGSINSAFGYLSLYSNTTGSYNCAFGSQSLQTNTTGIGNCAFGASSLYLNTSGGSNAGFGTSSLASNSSGSNNSAIGVQSLYSNTSGSNNSGLGHNTLLTNTSGTGNTAVGQEGLLSNSTGNYNTSIGWASLRGNTTSSENVSIGYYSFLSLSSGANNLSLGSQAGRYIADGATALTTSNNSLFIGYKARPNANSQTNQVVIGYDSSGIGSNTTTIGNSSTLATKVFGVKATGETAPTIVSAATIAPVTEIAFVSGTVAISTITAPTGISSTGGQITLIPTGIFTTSTAGNIALASTAVVGRALIMTYNSGTLKWYPSY